MGGGRGKIYVGEITDMNKGVNEEEKRGDKKRVKIV